MGHLGLECVGHYLDGKHIASEAHHLQSPLLIYPATVGSLQRGLSEQCAITDVTGHCFEKGTFAKNG